MFTQPLELYLFQEEMSQPFSKLSKPGSLQVKKTLQTQKTSFSPTYQIKKESSWYLHVIKSQTFKLKRMKKVATDHRLLYNFSKGGVESWNQGLKILHARGRQIGIRCWCFQIDTSVYQSIMRFSFLPTTLQKFHKSVIWTTDSWKQFHNPKDFAQTNESFHHFGQNLFMHELPWRDQYRFSDDLSS